VKARGATLSPTLSLTGRGRIPLKARGATLSLAGRARSRDRGFTLLEVMVALALLASALMAMADLAGGALRNHAYARDLSAATLLARGRLVALEQKYEDQGFKDFDETEEGNFSDEGKPEMRWSAQFVKPNADLSAEQLFATLAGASGGDPQELVAKLMGAGGAAPGSASSGGSSGGSPPQGGVATNPLAGAMTGMLQTQLTALGETLKKSFRELRFTVSWRDGKATHDFTVTTHLLVLNPRAPGGSRGDNPEVPANLAAAAAASQLAPNLSRAPGGAPATTPPATTGKP
jgi:general secretion pathway protein I